MSLLFPMTDQKIYETARQVYLKHFEKDPNLDQEYDDRRKRLMYDDILINLEYIKTAIVLDDGKIVMDYAIWIYHLLCSLMKDIDADRIKEQMIMHYEILNETLSEALPPSEASAADQIIKSAIEATREEADQQSVFTDVFSSKYLDIKKNYLEKLLKTDTRGAIKVILDAVESGIALEEVYIDILQEVMHQVGEMWHKNMISIDKEHYCTSTTQTAISQLYPMIFSQTRKGYKLIACCVGSELHEMGMRMVSDLVELNGWDSIYLGAGVPIHAVLSSIKENEPDLVGFSVTMPQHLPLCRDYIKSVRNQFPQVKIAVGGRAFSTTNHLWASWDIDIYAENASEFIRWAKNNIEQKDPFNGQFPD